MSQPSQKPRRWIVTETIARYPRRSVAVLVCLIFASLAESVGLLAVLPFLDAAGAASGEASNDISRRFWQAMAHVGIAPSVISALLIIGAFIIVKAALTYFALTRVGAVIAKLAAELRAELLTAVTGARWDYFLTKRVGVFVNASTSEVPRAASAYRSSVELVATTCQVFILLAVSCVVSPKMTLSAIGAGVLLFLLLGRFIRLAKETGRQQVVLMQSISGRFADYLQGIKPLKAMNGEHWVTSLLHKESQVMERAVQMQTIAKYAVSIMREPVMAIVLVAGAYLALEQMQIPMAELLTMVVLFYRTATSINMVQQNYQAVGTLEHSYWAVRDMIDEAVVQGEAKVALAGNVEVKFDRDIRFEHVSFAYGERPILRDVSLTIRAGSLVSLVGPSGAGKSTLADIVCGLFRPSKGRIYVDDVPMDQISLPAWRRLVGYVPQELFLFHDTIRNNITMGDPAITDADVEWALRKAEAWEFVRELPDGVETVTGERGVRLSGGQRQRLSIARALARRPALLLLDEATTALDPATEREIIQTLLKLRGTVTILAISHQTAMVDASETVFRLDGGVLGVIRTEDSSGASSHCDVGLSQKAVEQSGLI